MLFNLVRGAIANALRTKLCRTYGPLLQQSFGHATSGILTKDFVVPQVVSSNLSQLSFKFKRNLNTQKSHVKHNKDQNYFYIEKPGCSAKLKYEWETRKIVVITSTDVTDACMGQGFGKILAEEALTWIARNNYQVLIECEFVENFIKQNPKFQRFVLK